MSSWWTTTVSIRKSNRKQQTAAVAAETETDTSTTKAHLLSSSRNHDKGSSSYAQHFVIHHKPSPVGTRHPTRRPTPSPTQRGGDSGNGWGFIVTQEPSPNPTLSPSIAYDDTYSPTSYSDDDETNFNTPGIISGHAFFDSNNNGTFNSFIDKHIANVMVWLFSCGGRNSQIVASAKTSRDGYFTFENIAPGNYFVIIQLPEGYVASSNVLPWEDSAHGGARGSGNNIMEQTSAASTLQQHILDKAHDDNTMILNTRETEWTETICRSLCFKIHEGQSTNIELSFGMQLAPAISPSPPPSGEPTDTPSESFRPSWRPSMSPSRPNPTKTPTNVPSVSVIPTSGMPTTSFPSVSSSDTPSSSLSPSAPPSNSPTRNGEPVGPIQTRQLKITLFGIGVIDNEAEWSDGMALYINRYFNDKNEWHYAFNVNVDIVLTKQTSKVFSFGDEGTTNNNSGDNNAMDAQTRRRYNHHQRRHQQQQLHINNNVAVEITYDQISMYKTADATFADVSYLVREPFATTLSRYEYITFLQLLSPQHYASVFSVSTVTLPSESPPPQQENDVTMFPPIDNKDGNKSNTVSRGILIGALFICGIVLVLIVHFGCMHRARRKREYHAEQERKTREIRIREDSIERGSSKKSSEKSSGNNDSDYNLSSDRLQQESRYDDREATNRDSFLTERTTSLTGSLNTQRTHGASTVSHSACSEVIMDIIVPPGRVGCIIDSSPQRGPYICEIHEQSPLRDELQVGDRIILVDDDDVREMSAIDVSKMLGSRSLNEQRVLTILREFFYDVAMDEERSRESRSVSSSRGGDDGNDEEEKTVTSEDPPGIIW